MKTEEIKHSFRVQLWKGDWDAFSRFQLINSELWLHAGEEKEQILNGKSVFW